MRELGGEQGGGHKPNSTAKLCSLATYDIVQAMSCCFCAAGVSSSSWQSTTQTFTANCSRSWQHLQIDSTLQHHHHQITS
jgi:hypothetical protein